MTVLLFNNCFLPFATNLSRGGGSTKIYKGFLSLLIHKRSILSILRGRSRMGFQRFDIIHEIARIIPYPGRSLTCPEGNCCSRYYIQIASKINHPSGPSREARSRSSIVAIFRSFVRNSSGRHLQDTRLLPIHATRVAEGPCSFLSGSFLHPSSSLNLFPALSVPDLSLSFADTNYC